MGKFEIQLKVQRKEEQALLINFLESYNIDTEIMFMNESTISLPSKAFPAEIEGVGPFHNLARKFTKILGKYIELALSITLSTDYVELPGQDLEYANPCTELLRDVTYWYGKRGKDHLAALKQEVKRHSLSPRKKYQVLESQYWRCMICNSKLKYSEDTKYKNYEGLPARFDHIMPFKDRHKLKNPSSIHNIKNFQALCDPCNRKKHANLDPSLMYAIFENEVLIS